MGTASGQQMIFDEVSKDILVSAMPQRSPVGRVSSILERDHPGVITLPFQATSIYFL